MSASITEADSVKSPPKSTNGSLLQIGTEASSPHHLQQYKQQGVSPSSMVLSFSTSQSEIEHSGLHEVSTSSHVLPDASLLSPSRDKSKIEDFNQENIKPSSKSTSTPFTSKTLLESTKISRSPTGFIAVSPTYDQLMPVEDTTCNAASTVSEEPFIPGYSSSIANLSSGLASNPVHPTQSPKPGVATLQPSLPIISTAMLNDTPKISTPTELASNLDDIQTSPKLTSVSNHQSFSEVTSNPGDEVNTSPSFPVPPRSSDHTNGSSVSTAPLLNPRTRKPVPLKLNAGMSGSNVFEQDASPIHSIPGETTLSNVKQIDLLSTVHRSSSAPSTPIPPIKSSSDGKDRPLGIPSPLRNTYPPFDDCTPGELKITLSEKLIQLSQVQSQNAQLWTLVNKQRTMIFDLQKDLDGAVEQNEKYRAMLSKYQVGTPITSPIATFSEISLLDPATVKDSKASKVKSPEAPTKQSPITATPLRSMKGVMPSHSRSSSLQLEKTTPKSEFDTRRTSLDSRRTSLESKQPLRNELELIDHPPPYAQSESVTLTSTESSGKTGSSPEHSTANGIPATSRNESNASLPASKSSFDFNSIKAQQGLNSVCFIFISVKVEFELTY